MDIDQSKENIQPLRGGRNLAQLGVALQAQSDADVQRQLQQQKEEFETIISNYNGPDPLDPWFNYIQWVEQCYPKHGHEGHIDKLIKDCLQKFDMDVRYHQDRRFVKLWIKYIDCLPNPLEVYEMLHSRGVGIRCSEFYRAWAIYCEELNDYRKADSVYMAGMQAQAEPAEDLKQAHMQFQLSFAQRMLHDDSPTKRKAASALAETRQALTSLKSFKRRNIAEAPVQRVGERVVSYVPGVVRQQHCTGTAGNVMVNVYEEAPSTSRQTLPVPSRETPSSFLLHTQNSENEKEIGIWSNGKVSKKPVVPHLSTTPFTPYEDEGLILHPNHLPYCVDDTTFTVPLCVPDDPDPTKIPCYAKHLVYVDNTEYSLEEIRARRYLNQQSIKAQEIAKKLNEPQNIKQTLPTQPSLEQKPNYSALDTLANCALSSDNVYDNMVPLSVPALQNVTKVHHMHSPGEPKVLCNLDSKEFSELQNPAKDVNVYSDEAGYCKPNLAEEFNKSLLGNLHSDSVTVNTKEARWELRNLFTGNNEPSMVQPLVPNYQFDIHEDRSMTVALNTQNRDVVKEEVINTMPDDKENALRAVVNRETESNPLTKTFFEEPGCTQVFNFNIVNSSTPNMSQFKKPVSFLEQNKIPPAFAKFQYEEEPVKEEKAQELTNNEQPQNGQPNGLSAILEVTEVNSKSGSSGSSGHQSSRLTSGYSTHAHYTPGSNLHYDSTYNDPKRVSMPVQSRMPNGQYGRSFAAKTPQAPISNDHSYQRLQMTASNDQQYQKQQQGYNGFAAQRTMQPQGYQQNYAYPTTPQGFQSPPAALPQSPHPPMPAQHVPSPHVQSPHQVQNAHHIQSPTHVQQGYQSPNYGQGYQSPMQTYQNQNYNQSMHRASYHQTQASYQSPAPRQAYPNQFQQRADYNAQQQQPQVNGYHHSYQQEQYSQNTYQNHSYHNQSYGQQHNPASSPYQQKAEGVAYNAYHQQQQPVQNPMHYQVYQSPNVDHSYHQTPTQAPPQPMQTSPSQPSTQTPKVTKERKPRKSKAQIEADKILNASQNSLNTSIPQIPYKSPTSLLRSVRHEQPHSKSNPTTEFSNQFLNFISNRNEPKDNANTPKFSSSPNITQKMHKNLYVSSPEQAQVPPALVTNEVNEPPSTQVATTPLQLAKQSEKEKPIKDVSKRQLDFELRPEFQSEDSRDSIGKESRASISSRKTMQSDVYMTDMDSECSRESTGIRACSISMIETHEIARPADIKFPQQIDPFSRKLVNDLLEYVKFPNKTHSEGYFEVKSVPKMQNNTLVSVGTYRYSVEKQLGKGNYGSVYCCMDHNSGKPVALKYQKPAWPWEFYICQELKARVKDPFMLPGFMDISQAFIGDNASIFVSELSKFGSLLDVANKVRLATSKCICEPIVILFTAEMLSIIHHLHKSKIIHADIKPDNFLLMEIPNAEWKIPSLQLIDMGRSIDMSLLPERTTFKEMVTTEGFTCTEMRDGKPWTYQTDYYCLAGTIHVILFGSYMKVTQKLGQWCIDKKLPRYAKISFWEKMFGTLLNVPDCENLPDLMELKRLADNEASLVDFLPSELRKFANTLKSR